MEDTKEPDFIPQEKASTTADNSQVCDDDKRDRIESDSILDPKCPGGCKKRLTKDVCKPSRKCNLCGNLFCYDCTIYRRKLSQVIKFSTKKLEKSRIQFDIKLIPDDVLGTLHSVCCKCYESETEIPIGRNLMGDFAHFRRGKFEAEDTKAKEGSLCCKRYAYSTFKRRAVIKEVERLTQGFVESSSGFISELVSEVKIPKWHKSSNWVESGGVHHCYHCEKPFKKVLSTKVNCRIGGQVFCTECSKDEMILYLEEKGREPKWGINGKVGPQSKDLARFELCKICNICSDTLHTIFRENVALESERLKTSSFMDSIFQLQQSLTTLQDKVDKWLPDYIQALEALDGGNVGKINRDDKIKLAKLRFDVTHAQLVVKEMLYGFRKLQPQTVLQKKMLQNAQRGVQKIYDEHDYQMMHTRDLLSEEMIDELHEVQKLTSRSSMERVSADVYQMVADVVEHRDRYNLDDIIPDEADNILLSIDEEFLKGYPWKENYESMMKIRRKSFQIESGSQTATMTPDNVQCMIAGHCSRVSRNCYMQLETNTLETEYRDTKNSLKNAWTKFESML